MNMVPCLRMLEEARFEIFVAENKECVRFFCRVSEIVAATIGNGGVHQMLASNAHVLSFFR